MMNYETNRLNTFTNWPSSAPVDPARIAKAGFYYTGDGTEVQCFSCGGKISQWNYGDQVMSRHRQLDPNCAFVVNPQLSGNVPLVIGPECPSAASITSQSVPDDGRSESSHPNYDYERTEEDEMYKSDALRLLSYIRWDDTSVSQQALVNAGFYHVGEGILRCAWCGGELAFSGVSYISRFGQSTPLEVHRMYFPRCEHAATLEAAQQSSTISEPSTPNDTPVQTPPETEHLPQSSGAAHNERVLTMGGTWRALGVVDGGARVPQYAPLAARLASYQRWPSNRTQDPRALAEAGFFHTGTDDQVRCFYCDGGLGKWEAGDAPWSEHARWFPHCGYVLLVKGPEFVESCKDRPAGQRSSTAEVHPTRLRNAGGVNYPVPEEQIQEFMESPMATAALNAGLDAARVRRAIIRRLRSAGLPFGSSEALIDAVLDEQLNEEAWSVTPQSQRLARDILAETLRGFSPRSGIFPSNWDDRPDSSITPSASPTRSLTPEVYVPRRVRFVGNMREAQIARETPPVRNTPPVTQEPPKEIKPVPSTKEEKESENITEKKLTLEEENRQLKEARLCKVCMDCEVSVVFLPCGHLVSCARCGAALSACPLCRGAVKALVRAYLA